MCPGCRPGYFYDCLIECRNWSHGVHFYCFHLFADIYHLIFSRKEDFRLANSPLYHSMNAESRNVIGKQSMNYVIFFIPDYSFEKKTITIASFHKYVLESYIDMICTCLALCQIRKVIIKLCQR